MFDFLHSDFFSAAFAFPTAIFSVLLVLIIFYWLTVILGAADLDVLDGVFEWLEAADGTEGIGEGPEGSTNGGGLLEAFGIAGVPLTVSLSLIVVFGWFVTFSGMDLVGRLSLTGLVATLVGVVVVAVGFGVAVVLTALAVRPMKPLFATHTATERRDLVGKVCQVTTQRVSEGFGQAELADADGAQLILQVRCSGNNPLQRGSAALIYEYDSEKEVFLIKPFDQVLSR